MQEKKQKSVRVLVSVTLVYALLVATHLGEFWPFSIYPMFSQAGHPWTRSLVRDVTALDQPARWDTLNFSELPGKKFPIDLVGINQNDVANFIQKAGEWNDQRINGLRKLFSSELDQRTLVVMRVEGRLVNQPRDTISIHYIPYIVMSSDTTMLNPAIKYDYP